MERRTGGREGGMIGGNANIYTANANIYTTIKGLHREQCLR